MDKPRQTTKKREQSFVLLQHNDETQTVRVDQITVEYPPVESTIIEIAYQDDEKTVYRFRILAPRIISVNGRKQ